MEHMILPRDIPNNGPFSSLRVNNVSCVEYRSRQEVVQTRMLVTTSLFVVVLKGEKVLHTGEGDIYIPSGTAFFARKGAYLFSENLKKSREYHTLIFFIDDMFLADFLKAHPHMDDSGTKDAPVFKISLTPLLKNSADSFLPYFFHDSGLKEDSLRLKLQELLINLIEADQSGAFSYFLSTTWTERKKDLVRLMEDNYARPLTINDLAQLSGRSLSSFKRDFGKTFGTTPRQWITLRRLEQARALLLNQNHNVTEACFESGFENVSHFCRIFKKAYGQSPGSLKNITA